MRSHRRSAFTLVELLVVVAIIALLAGLVLVGVAMITEQSRRIACGNNLRSWGLCAIAASTDNQGSLLSSYLEGMTTSVQPQLMAVNDSAWLRDQRNYWWGQTAQAIHPMSRNMFTVVKASQFMDGGERVLQTLADTLGITVAQLVGSTTAPQGDGSYGINAQKAYLDLPVGAFSSWRCPSQRGGFFVCPANIQGQEAVRATTFIQGMGYSYFARSELWRYSTRMGWDKDAQRYTDERVDAAPLKNIMMYTDQRPAILQEARGAFDARADINGLNAICARTPDGDRILMTETLMYDAKTDEAMLDGHSRLTGPNHLKSFGTRDKRGSLEAMSGNYALLGDGRVAWRSRATWDLAKMQAAQENGWQTHYLGVTE